MTNLSSKNRKLFLEKVDAVKSRLPHGSVAALARRHPEIPLKDFYYVLNKLKNDVDILNLLEAEADKYEDDQQAIFLKLKNITSTRKHVPFI